MRNRTEETTPSLGPARKDSPPTAVRRASGKRPAHPKGLPQPRGEARRAEQSLRMLLEASTALASWADYEAALAEVARAAVPMLGEFCSIVVRDVNGHARRGDAGVVSQVDAGRAAAYDVIVRAVDASASSATRLAVPAIAGASDPSEPPNPSRKVVERAIEVLGFLSFVSVPIVTRDQSFGAIALLARERSHSASDLRLAEDLARRVASAVENAHLVATGERERAELAEANRAKDEFLSILSHELRTPLNSMLGWTQIARTGDLDGKMLSRALETIERNARAQAQLIADLLDVSCIVSGTLVVELAPITLRDVVEHAVEAARPLATTAGVMLEALYDLTTEKVNGDPARLGQVVTNLLSNAIKFTPNGASVRLVLDLDDANERARIRVDDDGAGIDPSLLPHVFERFRQAEGALSRARGGLGLGLAIVRHVVEAHGGDVVASSAGLGRGSRFSVTLPLLERAADDTPGARFVGSAIDSSELQGLRVLVVEDDDDGRDLLELLLVERGARVRAVPNAARALEVLGEGGIDVLVSDIGLPNVDGYELLKSVRALPSERGGAVPAVALTAYASPEDRARALEAGFDTHVVKPVESDALVRAVATVARTARESGDRFE